MGSLMEFEKTFHIANPGSKQAFQGIMEGARDLRLKYMRAETRPGQAVEVCWSQGTAEPGKIVWAGVTTPLIVHAAVLKVFEQISATGWTAFPVTMRNKGSEEISDFFGLAIDGRCGALDLEKSDIILREYPGGWCPFFRGRYYDPESWDGSDIFMESPDSRGKSTAVMLCTLKVKKALSKAKVSNMRYTRLTDLELNTSIFEIGGPYRLPRDFVSRVKAVYKNCGHEIPGFVRKRLERLAGP